MRGKAITKRRVDALKAADREYFVWDRDLKGFGLRVQPTGEKSYVVKYRAGSGRNAPTRRVTLGPVGSSPRTKPGSSARRRSAPLRMASIRRP